VHNPLSPRKAIRKKNPIYQSIKNKHKTCRVEGQHMPLALEKPFKKNYPSLNQIPTLF